MFDVKIKISYSWGKEEPLITIPEGKDPWKYMRELAVNEAEESFRTSDYCGPVGLEFYATEIILTYNKRYINDYEDDKCRYELIQED